MNIVVQFGNVCLQLPVLSLDNTPMYDKKCKEAIYKNGCVTVCWLEIAGTHLSVKNVKNKICWHVKRKNISTHILVDEAHCSHAKFCCASVYLQPALVDEERRVFLSGLSLVEAELLMWSCLILGTRPPLQSGENFPSWNSFDVIMIKNVWWE